MQHSNSQQLLSSDNQNEFLPNNTNSYESMIQEHTQRRSLILNDHLILPASHSELQEEHERQDGGDVEGEMVLQEQAEKGIEEFREVGMDENEENQFLVNENSLKESIRIAMVGEDSKMAASLGPASVSGVEHSAAEMLEQQQKIEENEEEMTEKEKKDGEEEEEGSLAENNEQIGGNRQSIKQESVKEEEQISQGSDGPKPVQASNELHLMEDYDSALKPSIENQPHFDQQQEEQKQQQQQEEMINDKAEKPSQMQEDEFIQQAKQTSLSQIQALHSQVQPRVQFQEDSEEQPNQEQNTKKQQNSQQQSQQPKQQQQQRSNNSLSKLMKLDYFPKQYDHSDLNMHSKQQLLLNPIESQVEIYKVKPNESQISNKKQVLKSKDDSIHSESHIAHQQGEFQAQSEHMEKTIPLSFREEYPIESIKELPRQSSKSIIHKINPSLHHQQSDNQEPANKISRSSHSRLSRSKHSHDKISNSSRSKLAKSIKSSSSRYKMKSSHQYFNQFAEQPIQRQSSKSKHSVIKSNRSYIKNPQPYEDQYNMLMRQITPKESELKESQENPYKSSKLTHKLQKSAIDNPSNAYEDFHLPQIQAKSRKSNISNHSKPNQLSQLSKKTPSLHIENSSRLSLAASKQSSIKKNTFKLESLRENFISYSEGIHINPQLSPRNQEYLNSAVESQVSTVKKKDGPKEIFNTFPETFNVVSSEASLPKNTSDWQEPKESNALQSNDLPNTVKSPQKSKDTQLQRLRLLKQAKRKRLQRQLQKVKKELAQINARERNMDRIYEQKQKIQAKERQNTVKSREKDSAKQNRLNVENEVIMRIIKEHRKQKEDPERKITDIDDNITKNLMELNAIRKAAQQKQKQKKKMEILQRMKKNEMRKLNDQKLVKANNHYVQQLKSAQIRVQSPPHKTSNEKLQANRRPARQPTNPIRNSKASPMAKNKLSLNYQQKLD